MERRLSYLSSVQGQDTTPPLVTEGPKTYPCQIVPINLGDFNSHIFSYVTAALLADDAQKTACDYMSWLFANLPLKTVSQEMYVEMIEASDLSLQLGSEDIYDFRFDDADILNLNSTPYAINLIEEHHQEVKQMLTLTNNYQSLASTFFPFLQERYGNTTIFIGTHLQKQVLEQTENGFERLEKLMNEVIDWLQLFSQQSSFVFMVKSDYPYWFKSKLKFLENMNVEFITDHVEDIQSLIPQLKNSDMLFMEYAVLSSCHHSLSLKMTEEFYWTSFLAPGYIITPAEKFGEADHPDLVNQIERARSDRYHAI